MLLARLVTNLNKNEKVILKVLIRLIRITQKTTK